MQFLNPIWLFGVSGILIPIIIHLWNIKSGKVLKVGSIMLMGESSRENSRSLKLQDYLQLLLRCLIIIFLSLLLAEPVFNSLKTDPSKGWVLITRTDLKEGYENFKPEIDSLLSAEYEFRFFEPGFPQADLADYLEMPQDTVISSDLSFWALTRELKEISPPGVPIRVYSNRLMENFEGSRTSIPGNISWKTFAPDLNQQSRIRSAWLANSDSIGILLASSDTSIIRNQLIKISSQGRHPDFKLSLIDGLPAVSFIQTKNDNTDPVIVDTSSIRIGIYSGNYADDLPYLKAAFTAVKEFTSRSIEIHDFAAGDSSSEYTLLFWLSDKAIPTSLAGNKETMIFAYAIGETLNSNSRLLSSELNISEKSPIALFKRINVDKNSSYSDLWYDASGNTLLSKNSVSGQTIYQFYSRFNPNWSELVWSARFPELLLPIILEKQLDEKTQPSDIRTVDQQIIQTSDEAFSGSTAKSDTKTPSRKIGNWVLVLILILIGTERLIAHKKQNARYGI